MAAQAATKEKDAEAVLQAKIDAEVKKRTKHVPVQSPALPMLTSILLNADWRDASLPSFIGMGRRPGAG